MRAFVEGKKVRRVAGARLPDAGFLLLEALVGLAIIGIVAVALLAAAGQQVRSADQASVLLTASALAQDRAAAFHFLDVAALDRPPDSLLAGRFRPPFEEFGWEAEVGRIDDEHELFAVRVEVSGRGELFRSETLLHRPTGAAGAGPVPGAPPTPIDLPPPPTSEASSGREGGPAGAARASSGGGES